MGTVAAVKVLGTTEEDVGADLRIKVVGAVVFALFKEVAAFKEETGMLTSVPVWPFVMDKGNWMSRGWPVAIMPFFNTSVLVGL